MKKFIIVISVVTLMSCSDAKGTIKFLKSQGYTNIETTGFDFFAHGEEDFSTTGFIAVTPTGKKVKGAVSNKGLFSFFRPQMNIRIWKEIN